MKRAQFAPGFAELRGNISGKQKLEYPKTNNKAYESPVGSRNYATNYRPSVIVSQRAKDGKFHFAIKTKSAIGMTAKSKKTMALLGGTGAIIAAILRTPAIRLRVEAAYGYEKSIGATTADSLRKFLTTEIKKGLSIKHRTVFTARESLSQTIVINNPWVEGGTGVDVQVTNESLVKFWGELANSPIFFTVNGQKGIAHAGDDFDLLISGEPSINVLGLSLQDNKVVMEGSYVLSPDDEYVDGGTTIEANGEYNTTDVAPV